MATKPINQLVIGDLINHHGRIHEVVRVKAGKDLLGKNLTLTLLRMADKATIEITSGMLDIEVEVY